MKRAMMIVNIIWIVLVATSFTWNYVNAKKDQEAIAFQAARSFFDQVVVSRSWNAGHGGVYVPVTEDTPPNPYLKDPLRDIKVNKDLTLTKINPAFMTRQISEIAARRKGINFHITSLKPLRPENRATPLEEKALKSFEQGVHEFGSIIHVESNSNFFYMAPLLTEKSCLKCHAEQGYKEGDIRGGISVTLPFVPQMPFTVLTIGHIIIGLTGALGIVLFGAKLNNAHESIRRQAVIDALTGIPNRRSFSEHVLKEYKRSQRDKLRLSIIMGDIDSFKSYNDTYGHTAGDECLRKVAQTIDKTLKRPSDFCARYGGEEFIMILPSTPQEGVVYIAEEVRSNIEGMQLPHEKSSAGVVTISLGVATIDVNDSLSHEELIKRADNALYWAKDKGRNRVEVFQNPV